MNPLLPTITLNGTHPQTLADNWDRVAAKIGQLRQSIACLELNGRDYAPGTFGAASERIGKFERAMNDFEFDVLLVRIHIAKTRGNR